MSDTAQNKKNAGLSGRLFRSLIQIGPDWQLPKMAAAFSA
jgi:hypothetical protein